MRLVHRRMQYEAVVVDQAFLAVLPLLRVRGELGDLRELQGPCSGW